MLKEFTHLKQIEGEHRRRWFSDDYFDLIVWYDEADTIVGFQLCYNIGKDEHAITWFRDKSFSHAKVDDGDDVVRLYKSSPILVADGEFNPQLVAEKFKEAAAEIDPEVAKLVYEITMNNGK